MRKLNPGPLATPRQADKAAAEALALLDVVIKNELNLSGAAKYIRRKRPSAPAIAALAFVAYPVLFSAQQGARGKWRRKHSMREQMRQMRGRGVQTWSQAKEKEPETVRALRERGHDEEILAQAFSKVKHNNLP